MINYENKENYITRHPNPLAWKQHANFQIMKNASEYIKGDCADLGCNHGACTWLLLEFPNVNSITGFDINEKAIQVASSLTDEIKPFKTVEFIQSNLMKINTPDNKYDFIMSFHTLEHIYPNDIDIVISEFNRILKKECFCLI